MSTPLITSVSPSAITTVGGGQLIITGSGFKLPVDPLSGPGPIPWPTPEPGQSVRVRLYSEAPGPVWSFTFPHVRVASETKIKLDVPALPLPRNSTNGVIPSIALKVEVSNLDDSEEPIDDELVVYSSLLLRRPLLAGNDANSLTRAVTANLINHLEMICPNVSVIPDVDWDDDISTEKISQAKQPALVLIGPFIVRSMEGRAGLSVIELRPTEDTYTHTHALTSYDYDYRILGITNNASELQNLIGALLGSVMRYQSLDVYPDPLNPDFSKVLRFDMSFPRPPSVETQIQSLNSNLRIFKADLAVHSVPAAGVDSFLDDSVAESGGIIGSGTGDCPGDAEHVTTGTGVELCISDLFD